MRLVKLVICLIGLVGLCYAQSGSLSWSIYQVVLTNSTAPAPITSAVFTNVGQTTHEVVVTLSPQPTKTCPQLDTTQSSLQFSFDGVTYTNFGVAINPSTNPLGLTFIFVGTGAYPRVRFFLGQYDNVDCFATAFYSGATTNPYTQIVGSATNGTPAPPPVVIGGVGNTGTVQGFAACNATQGGTIPAGTTAAIIGTPAVTPANNTVKICSLALSAGVAATATLISGTGATCTTGPITYFTGPLAAGIPFSYGVGIGAVVTGTPGQTFCITAAGNPVNYSVSWATSAF
jgi:hypothetical protein